MSPSPYRTTPLSFLLRNPLGMMITLTLTAIVLYFLAPVFLHNMLWEGLVLNLPYLLVAGIGCLLAFGGWLRYGYNGGRINAITTTIAIIVALVSLGSGQFLTGLKWVSIYNDTNFQELETPLGVSNELVRFTPLEIAQREILRRNQASEFTPGGLKSIGSEQGVAYISPLVPQGTFNVLLMQNQGFMYFDDYGTDEEQNRTRQIATDPFQWGEGMEISDDIQRRLVHEVGFTNSYPEIYYAPVYNDQGEIEEVVGVVPYISYRFNLVFVPVWGGVAIFHADGSIEDLSPEEATKDPRLTATRRAFPEKLVRDYVHAQRYDKGFWSGWIRRPGKIEVPDLPGSNQMPYFLPMEDGSYQYVTSVEPDGEGFSVMRIYYINALTGERTVFRFDNKDGNTQQNLIGPAKALEFVTDIEGYNWYRVSGTSESGAYRAVEPRPVTPEGSEHLHWMVTVTNLEYSNVVATAFVDAETNQVHGPFKSREETFAFLRNQRSTSNGGNERLEDLTDDLSAREGMCEEIETIWIDYCGQIRPPLGSTR